MHVSYAAFLFWPSIHDINPLYAPNRRGHIGFAVADRPRRCPQQHPRSFAPEHYLLNKWMYFDQICIDTLLGGRKELIKWRP